MQFFSDIQVGRHLRNDRKIQQCCCVIDKISFLVAGVNTYWKVFWGGNKQRCLFQGVLLCRGADKQELGVGVLSCYCL